MPRFIITFPRDIKANEPIAVDAKDRLWALTELAMTVWTEDEWKWASERVRQFASDQRNTTICHSGIISK